MMRAGVFAAPFRLKFVLSLVVSLLAHFSKGR
jgi:hypothetical protein